MKKRICFFSTGFAFNRLNRMRFYEKIFPKETEIYLFTTTRHSEKDSAKKEWDLERTKIFVSTYNLLKLPIEFRKFCKENKIERVVNLGSYQVGLLFFFSLLLTKTEFLTNILGWVYERYKSNIKSKLRAILFYLSIVGSKRVIFNDALDLNRTSKMLPWLEMRFLPAPVDSSLFKPKNKVKCRTKLKLPQKKNIVLFVGRVNYGKGADILYDLINKNEDILFLVIGKIDYPDFVNFKPRNMIHYPKKTSRELVDFYNAADLGFFLQRARGGGLGLTTEECMACGVPAINRNRKGLIKSPALIQVSLSKRQANKVVLSFFEKSEKERKKLSKLAREYAEKNFSYEACKKNYIRYYLD